MPSDIFQFKQFSIAHHKSSMKVGTDAVLLGAWADYKNASTILDIGTGSGVIAIMAAQNNPDAFITGIDIDKNSIEEAHSNGQKSPWADRLSFIQTSLQNYNHANFFDHILTNPPYFKNGSKSPKNVRASARHMNSLVIEEIFQYAKPLLTKIGQISMILPALEISMVINQAETENLHLIRKMEFRSKENKPLERILLTFSKVNKGLKEERLTHYDENNNWSMNYIALTKNFYIKL